MAEGLIGELEEIRAELLAAQASAVDLIASVPETHRRSATNLLHYVTLRQRDLRSLQDRLAALGLSSLGRAEAHVLQTVEAVRRALNALASSDGPPPERSDDPVGFAEGSTLLDEHTRALFGPPPPDRDVHVMVTMPSEAATDPVLVRDLLASGMGCMRINCAHDAAPDWAAMIANLRAAEQELERRCRVLMDLAGPKLRTGPLQPGPAVLKLRPRRDAYGVALAPVQVWLLDRDAEVPADLAGQPWIAVAGGWLARLAAGDKLRLSDARDARRTLTVLVVAPGRALAECAQTTYLRVGTELRRRHGGRRRSGARDVGTIAALPPRVQPIELRRGDELVLTRALDPGHAAERDQAGGVVAPAAVGCTLPEVFAAARAGEPVWLDDGKIGAQVEAVEPDALRLRITHARPAGERLRAEKGINLPDTDLRIAGLTPKDAADLAFIAAHADLVGLSFVREPAQVHELARRLADLGQREVGIVLKIETKRAFERLPLLLLAAMRFPSAGVMIARGDLAVECGFERLAEVQEEILWAAEAAHLPVVWATQVLETLATKGRATRAEVTDAAMGVRAECVMLNKGPYVVEAVRALCDILRRMGAHQSKKRTLLRQLRSWSQWT